MIVFRKTGGWSGVGGFGGVGGNEEEFFTSYSSMGDLSVIKGANRLWPTNWVNMLVSLPSKVKFEIPLIAGSTSSKSRPGFLKISDVSAYFQLIVLIPSFCSNSD